MTEEPARYTVIDAPGPIELKAIKPPLDYSANRTLFDGMDTEYSPLPGIALVLGIAASLMFLGALLGYFLATRSL